MEGLWLKVINNMYMILIIFFVFFEILSSFVEQNIAHLDIVMRNGQLYKFMFDAPVFRLL